MENLYQLVIQLRNDRSTLYNELVNLEHSIRVKKRYYNEIYDEYAKLDREIKQIEQDHKIGIVEMADILKKYTGVSYEPKIFAEKVVCNGQNRYTRQYVACYINDTHPYYKKKNADIIYLFPDEYNEILRGLSDENSIVFSSSDRTHFEPLEPSLYLANVNFIYLYTRGHADSVITSDFIKQAKPFIKQDLEQTHFMSNDNEFEQGI